MKPELEIALSILAYSACSGSLVLVNKLILYNLPYPSLVVCVQLAATLVFIYGSKFYGLLKVDGLIWEYIVPYIYYIVAFSLGVYCNMKSLTLSNVETVVVFRSLTPVLVAFLDAMFLGREYPSVRSWTALFTIVVGAYGYASFDDQFQTQGWNAYAWPFAYLFLISFEMAYGKKIVQSVPLKTFSGPVLYTNLLGLPPMLAFAAMGHEYGKFHQDVIVENHAISLGVWFLILLGCVAGTAIGYSAWWCRDKVSATTFTLVGVINKCLTIMLNFVIWDQHAKPGGVLCLLLCLVGGTLYRQAPLREQQPTDEIKYQPIGGDEKDLESANSTHTHTSGSGSEDDDDEMRSSSVSKRKNAD